MLFLAYSFLLLAFLLFMMNVTDRFLKYVGYGTQSDPNTGLNPSTPGQMEFAHVLKEEMEAIGIQEVELDEYGYVMGVIPSTVERETPAIGFIAHMDTSPEMSGRHVNPRIIENYAGNDIVLNEGNRTFDGGISGIDELCGANIDHYRWEYLVGC